MVQSVALNGSAYKLANLCVFSCCSFQNGETAYSIAKNKLGNDKVCEELKHIESKKQVAVRSISTSQMIAVSVNHIHDCCSTILTLSITCSCHDIPM